MKIWLVLIALLVAFPAIAQAGPQDITIGGVWCIKIVADVAGVSADQRVLEVRKGVTEILHDPSFHGKTVSVTIVPQGTDAVLKVGKYKIITLTPADVVATGAKISVMEYAQQVAARFQKGLNVAMPGIAPPGN